MRPRDSLFFLLVFLAVLAVGVSLSAANVALPPTTVCTNTDAVSLTLGQTLLLAPNQIDPACPIINIQAALLGNVPGASVAQTSGNAVALTVPDPLHIRLTYGTPGETTENPEEQPIQLLPNSFAIFGQ